MVTLMGEEGKTMLRENKPVPVDYTYADYLKWKFGERLELINGRAIELPAPGTRHQAIVMNLHLKMGHFLEKHPFFVFIAPFDVRLPQRNKQKDNEVITVVQPDVGIVCDVSKIDERGCCGAPDLVVEVLSPGNSQKEVQLKYKLYEEAGVKEYWIINTAEENIVVFILNEQGKFGGGRMYAAKSITPHFIPELRLELKDIFKNPLCHT